MNAEAALDVVTKPVVVARSRPFAWLCLEIWKERDGRDRVAEQWLDRVSIDVPADIVAEAGARMRAKRAG